MVEYGLVECGMDTRKWTVKEFKAVYTKNWAGDDMMCFRKRFQQMSAWRRWLVVAPGWGLLFLIVTILRLSVVSLVLLSVSEPVQIVSVGC